MINLVPRFFFLERGQGNQTPLPPPPPIGMLIVEKDFFRLFCDVSFKITKTLNGKYIGVIKYCSSLILNRKVK